MHSKELKNTAGAFVTGVTVICIEGENGVIEGLTANSFVSISLNPAVVMISVQNGSNFLNHCSTGIELGISILSSKQQQISLQFARQNLLDIPITFISKDKCHTIKDSLAWYETTVRELIEVGDHQLIFCDVHDVGRKKEGEPLVYYSGYRNIGKALR